ncbi:MAG TPA: D-alanine--D-alanine ligase family protein [Actinomycetes bacterium]|jgi:D-alanine-D-alanine ligase|nr:D-alanine--D-alanine ligase family protein [Actinomycetes bacterium]
MSDTGKRKLRLALVFGGRSAEHAVSVSSARSVIEALDPERFEVVPVGITREGAWMLPRTSLLELSAPEGGLPEVEAGGTAIALRPEQRGGALTLADGASGQLGEIDAVLPILHGPYGEDGTVQGLFELADLPYAGAGVLASALAMDKSMAKVVLAQAGLAQGRYLVVREHEWRADRAGVARRVAGDLAYPVFTKPARLGSSIGVSKVKSTDELAAGLEAAFAHDAKVLVEQGVVARELEVGIIGNQTPEASVVGEVIPGHEFYDFEAKYLDESSKLVIPAPVPSAVAERVRELAVSAFRALDCEGFARVDFFYVDATAELLVNEVNTIPGFTPKSMFPMLWEASGVPYPQLIAHLVDLAVERHQAKKG